MRVKSGTLLVVLVVLVVGAMALLTGCPKEPQSPPVDSLAQVPPPMTPQGEPYKIGGLFAITGPAAPLGEPEANTAKMIADRINAEGGINGRPVEIIIRDTKGEETEALNACKELIEKEKVLAIVGTSRTGTTMGIIETVEKAQVPLISCAAGVKITDPVKKWVFKTPQTDADAVKRIYAYLKSKQITKVATLTCSDAYGESGLDQLKKQAEAAGITIVAEEQFADTDADMTSQLTKIKGKNPEVVICWGVGKAPALVAKNMKQLGMTQTLIQSHGVANAKFLETAAEAANGVILPAGKLLVAAQLPDTDPQKKVLLEFATEYEKVFGKKADTFGGHAWDGVQMVLNGIRQGGDDRAKIRDAIEATQGFVGISGVFTYSATDHYGLTSDAFVMIEVKDGQWTLISE